MSSFSEKLIKGFKAILPSPLSIALILTALTFIMAILFTKNQDVGLNTSFAQLANYWEKGFWGFDLIDGNWKRSWQLPFLLQMMLMLVLGYILALSPPINKIIQYFVRYCDSTAKASLIISFATIIVSFFNWGLGLVFGAIFARKVAEHASIKQIKINYGLIGAAGYSGMMVWHGGLSGSAPIKVAEANSLQILLPHTNFGFSQISLGDTIFSPMNLFVSGLLIVVIPIVLYLIGKKSTEKTIHIPELKNNTQTKNNLIGAEKLDYSPLFSKLIGVLIICMQYIRGQFFQINGRWLF